MNQKNIEDVVSPGTYTVFLDVIINIQIFRLADDQ